ncbi:MULTISPECIES: GlxA family transcriptional regulator [unclassified Mesorhizobium]|uniref:GlxA family transcriptional regulator n=1 Tax=unclassified Mesorhizobium TaxID=325217 RepID=UPI001092D78D|nr:MULTISPECIES: GlxA family transcriptional regulator [unclassified Mesorhizobium]TGQ40541.1 GlxA family transcriptional regulator [Mesorhizobium sp. M4B.F.Ca.ET.214.01.1.1]TGQ60598.1 GlxA family transcriptional regulator [Mesorhizobium sp. M4B.F.Ca.ET.211.01.1.1]TGU36466.1 GlxA family transcriptional regulator [Mesorhizobium sp. M4B.F.Ca.ET.150.01.1.1]TIX17032.1 MAG: GlxA family transcriptional regulator [Mesorhizobium sp.]
MATSKMESNSSKRDASDCSEYVLVLSPGFSNLSLSALIEPLYIANKILLREQFKWRFVSSDGQGVTSSSGFQVSVANSIEDESKRIGLGVKPRRLVLCTGEGVHNHIDATLLRLIRYCTRIQVPIVAIGTATFVLAHAGLLTEGECTVHWPQIAVLAESYGRINVQNALFVTKGSLTTCAGELSTFDFAIDLITNELGPELAREVRSLAVADQSRSGEQRQTAPPGLGTREASDKLMKVVGLMERHADEKLRIDELAQKVQLSRRQIERMFRRHVGATPWQYYTTLRLERARQMVRYTSLPIIEVAVACGFETPSHFTKRFRDQFDISPSALRRVSTPKR